MNILYRYITKSLHWVKFPGHSAEWKSWCVADILRRLGLSIYAVNWKDTPPIAHTYDAVFDVSGLLDLTPAFGPDTVKILHLTGSDNVSRNQAEAERVAQVNARRGCALKQQRVLPDPEGTYKSIEMADFVIMNGNQETLNTYPEKYHDKIRLIDTVATVVD